jgi:hypothetical protein
MKADEHHAKDGALVENRIDEGSTAEAGSYISAHN